MQEICLGKIGVPADGGGIRLGMAIINKNIYKVEILQDRATFVKCTTPDAHILRVISMWASFDSYAGLPLQDFIKKMYSDRLN